MSSQPRGTLLRNDHGPPNAAPVPTLPRWVRVADVVTILLGVAALQAALFGGFQIPGLSITNPWRPLVFAVVLALPVPHISLAGLVNHPNSSRSSKAKAMATSWM